MRRFTLVGLVLLALAGSAGAEPLFERGLILPAETLPCYPVGGGETTSCIHHASTVDELPDGTMVAVWYHGTAEKAVDKRLVWSKLPRGSSERTYPELLFDDPDLADGNAVVWAREDGKLFVFFVSLWGERWDTARIRLITSDDLGETWSDPVYLRDEPCWNVRQEPVRTPAGDLLLPCYMECLGIPVFLRSSDDGATWSEEPPLDLRYFLQHVGQFQPTLEVLKDGRITMMTRDGMPARRIGYSVSDDDGHSWTRNRKLWQLPNSGTGIDQIRTRSNAIIVVYNDSREQRFPLTVALSEDGGERFIVKRDLIDECETEHCRLSYPSIVQSSQDDSFLVTYSHNVGPRTIGWVRFDEEWLRAGEPMRATTAREIAGG